MYVYTFQPENCTGWSNEGVNVLRCRADLLGTPACSLAVRELNKDDKHTANVAVKPGWRVCDQAGEVVGWLSVALRPQKQKP